jgi:hypothetical protein
MSSTSINQQKKCHDLITTFTECPKITLNSLDILFWVVPHTVPFRSFRPSRVTGACGLDEFGHLSRVTTPHGRTLLVNAKTVKNGYLLYILKFEEFDWMSLNPNPNHCVARNIWSYIGGWLFFGVSHDPSEP